LPLPADAAAALGRLERFGVRLGLARMARLLAALGHPQRRLPAVLVAGSNGKGSTAALLAAMAGAAGYSTGLYTSPHLEEVEERLRIDGRAVDGERLGRRILEVAAAADRTRDDDPPTYFEALTAAAWLEMAGREVDLAVLEVGLGGRLDATNLADPLLSLLTPVSLEHREYLGDTLAAIAGEKAGVMRRGRPAIAWTAEPEVEAALREAAARAGATLRLGHQEAAILAAAPLAPGEAGAWAGQRVEIATARRRYRLETPLLGTHQARNLAHATLAAETLHDLGWRRIGAGAIAAGAAALRWPGRLEVVASPPGAEGDPRGRAGAAGSLPRRVLLDVAHNPGAAVELATFLAGLPPLPAGSPRAVDLLFGILADKDAAATLSPLLPLTRRRVLTRPPHDRGRDPGEVAALLPPGRDVEVEPDPATALDRALAPPPDGGGAADTLLVCGSFYLVGAVRRRLRERFGVPPATLA
jgi:dihydrofolate synthase/folylpolyglutamate synthase